MQFRYGQKNIFVSLAVLLAIFSVLGSGAVSSAYGYGYQVDPPKPETPPPPKETPVVPTPPVAAPQPTAVASPVVVSDDTSNDKKVEDPKRVLKNSSKNVQRGDVLVQTGKYFSKNTAIVLYFSRANGGYYPPTTVQTDGRGMFSVNYKVAKPKGSYSWYAVDTKNGRKSKTSTYNVVVR